ncbi:hypothetical protein [Nonomuraea typhae]|uniref:hypothetical protein n=1 Tax=Nonomuraea typhae TaxID=2603600 RepID=UPI0012FC3CF9|nr:hypothetical protein [Nonomuraea typhae]
MNRLLPVLAGLYFAQGVPVGFSLVALPALLYGEGVDLGRLGMLGILIMPWALKFLWAPQIDNRPPPLRLGAGRRAGWVLTCQLAAIPAAALLLAVDPVRDFLWLLAVLFVLNILFATQDIATDALAVTRLAGRGRLNANAVQGGAFSVGLVAGGSGTLLAFALTGWPGTVACLVLLLAAGTAPLWWSRTHLGTTTSAGTGEPAPGGPDAEGPVERASIRRFLRRKGSWGLLALSAAYKLPLMMGYGLVNSLLVKQGASYTTISVTAATVVTAVSVAGAAVAPRLTVRLGFHRFLFTALALAAAVWMGLGLWLLLSGDGIVVPILAQALGYLLITSAVVTVYALFMAVSDQGQAGTDYTLLYCAEAFGNAAATGLAGALAGALGFAPTFIVAGACGLLLLPVLISAFRRLRQPAASLTA